jgi:haloalkane dehalogenase
MPVTLTRRRAVAGVAGLPLLGFAPPLRPILGQTPPVAAAAPGGTSQAPAVPPEVISADFPYESHFVDVLDSQMHYVDEGEGEPFLLIHGAPTSSYLWRNVIPWLVPHGRVIAVDLIGMGKSGKPDIAYTYADQARYLEAFVEALDLRGITLVLHDWGSALGFDYAARHETNVTGLAFMEALVAPAFPTSYDALSPELATFFRTARDPKTGPALFIDQNAFIEQILPNALVRHLSEAELDAYRAPFREPACRKPLLAFPNQVPIDGEPADVVAVFERYNAWLLASTLPKLHVYASPGSLNPLAVIDFLSQHLTNFESAYVGRGLHLIQEDFPEAVGRAIADWSRRLGQAQAR